MSAPVSAEAVLAGVAHDEARTTTEVASVVCGPDAWRQRTNVRNRLHELEADGSVISDGNRPLRWLRPEVAP